MSEPQVCGGPRSEGKSPVVGLEVPWSVEGGPVSWRPYTPSEAQPQSLGPEQGLQSQPGCGGAREEGLLSIVCRVGSGPPGLGFPGAGVPSATAWGRTQVGRGLGRAGQGGMRCRLGRECRVRSGGRDAAE